MTNLVVPSIFLFLINEITLRNNNSAVTGIRDTWRYYDEEVPGHFVTKTRIIPAHKETHDVEQIEEKHHPAETKVIGTRRERYVAQEGYYQYNRKVVEEIPDTDTDTGTGTDTNTDTNNDNDNNGVGEIDHNVPDSNNNGVPDDLEENTDSVDEIDHNVPDDNNNGVPDDLEENPDANDNGVPDDEEFTGNAVADLIIFNNLIKKGRIPNQIQYYGGMPMYEYIAMLQATNKTKEEISFADYFKKMAPVWKSNLADAPDPLAMIQTAMDFAGMFGLDIFDWINMGLYAMQQNWVDAFFSGIGLVIQGINVAIKGIYHGTEKATALIKLMGGGDTLAKVQKVLGDTLTTLKNFTTKITTKITETWLFKMFGKIKQKAINAMKAIGNFIAGAIDKIKKISDEVFDKIKKGLKGTSNLDDILKNIDVRAMNTDEFSTLIKNNPEAADDIIAKISSEYGTAIKNNPLRQEYESAVSGLSDLATKLKADGLTDEAIARQLHQARRDLGVKYKDLSPQLMKEYIYDVNVGRYDGDPLGPTIDFLRNTKKKSWADIISSSTRPNGDVDTLLGGFKEWLELKK